MTAETPTLTPLPTWTAGDIISQYEKLDYAQRMSSLVELGRLSLKHETISTTINTLFQGPLYERLLALQTAYGARNAGLPLLALKDASKHVQDLGVRLVSVFATDDEIRAVAKELPVRLMRSLLPKLRRRRRVSIVEAVLTDLYNADRARFLRLFHYGSADFVRQNLEEVLPDLDAPNWAKLAKIHPLAAIDGLLIRLAESEEPSLTLTWTINKKIPLITSQQQSFRPVIDIIRVVHRLGRLTSIIDAVQAVLDRYPKDVLEILLDSLEDTDLNWCKAFEKAPAEKLIEFHRKRPNILDGQEFKTWFNLFSSKGRLVVFQTLGKLWYDEDGILGDDIIEQLPTKQRIEEARRQLKLAYYVDRPSLHSSLISLLPWDEALTMQQTYLESSQYETRAWALRHQIQAVVYQRDRAPEALELIVKRRYENDSVRQSMLAALALWPRSMFREEYLDTISTISQQALEASDISRTTVSWLTRLIKICFPDHPSWSLDLYSKLIVAHDPDAYNDIDLRKAKKEVLTEVDNKLEPHFQRLFEARDFDRIWQLLQHFEWTSCQLPKAEAVLRRIALEAKDESTAYRCFNYLVRGEADVASLVRQLVAQDVSWIRDHTVINAVQRFQQTLLTPYLTYGSFPGRFNRDGEKELIIFDLNLQRWTAAQQEKYAQSIVAYLEEHEDMRWREQRCIKILAELHFSATAANAVIRFASNERPIVRDTSVRALARLDEQKGVPELVNALGDDRARIAIYSLAGALRKMKPNEAFTILKNTETKKVTVHKEIVRLIGDLGTDEAFHYLQEVSRSDEIHIDVRIALLRRLWDYVDRQDLTDIFTTAIHSSKVDVASSLFNITPYGFSDVQNTLMRKMISAGLKDKALQVRFVALNRCKRWPSPDPENELATILADVICTAKLNEAKLAAEALLYEKLDKKTDLIVSTFQKLLLDKRRLSNIFPILLEGRIATSDSATTIRQVLAVLQPVWSCQKLYLELMFQAAAVKDLASLILEAIPRLDAEDFVLALSLAKRFLPRDQRPGVDLEALEKTLKDHSDEKCRRLGLGVLQLLVAEGNEWTPSFIARLREYQDDASHLVAGAALWVFPSDYEA